MANKVCEIEFPKGKYILCDPCYVMRDELYDRFEWFKTDKPTRNRDGECGIILESDGKKAVAFLTMYGDGEYPGTFSDDPYRAIFFGVDSGTIGVVPEEWIDKDPADSHSAFLRFDGPAKFAIDDLGEITLSMANGRRFSIRTAETEELKAEQYDFYRLRWLVNHIDDGNFLAAVAQYGRSPEFLNDDLSFMDWIRNNGFGGEIYAALEDADLNGQLSWERVERSSFPGWLKAAAEIGRDNPERHFFSHRMDSYINKLAGNPEKAAELVHSANNKIILDASVALNSSENKFVLFHIFPDTKILEYLPKDVLKDLQKNGKEWSAIRFNAFHNLQKDEWTFKCEIDMGKKGKNQYVLQLPFSVLDKAIVDLRETESEYLKERENSEPAM